MKTKVVKTGMNYLILCMALCCIRPVDAARYEQPKVDFAGEWVLNEEKGDSPLPIEKLTVETVNDSLIVTMFPAKDHGAEYVTLLRLPIITKGWKQQIWESFQR